MMYMDNKMDMNNDKKMMPGTSGNPSSTGAKMPKAKMLKAKVAKVPSSNKMSSEEKALKKEITMHKRMEMSATKKLDRLKMKQSK
ncbi:MAG: hypothetical protein ACI9YE_000458 [Psychroserpens sp.]|jgi:hypothetical protein